MLRLDQLKEALRAPDLLGPDMSLRTELAHPPIRYVRIVGTGAWNEDRDFPTMPTYLQWIAKIQFKPRIVAKADGSPIASRITGRVWLKGKTAYGTAENLSEGLNCGSKLFLKKPDAFHLNLGHELTHSFAKYGGFAGKTLFLLSCFPIILTVSALILLICCMIMNIQFTKIYVEASVLYAVLYAIQFFLEPNTNRQGWHEQGGTVLSYDREEIVAEIGACILYAEANKEPFWPDYSIKLIAFRLASARNDRREALVALAYHEAKRRLSRALSVK